MIVGIIAVAIYLVVAPTLAFLFDWGFLGLVMGNAVQLTAHAILMLVFFHKHMGSLRGHGVIRSALKVGAASVGVGLSAWGTLALVRPWAPAGFLGQALAVAVPTAVGMLVYFGAARLLRVQELDDLINAVRRRIAR